MTPKRVFFFLILSLPLLFSPLTAQGRPEISSMQIAGEEVDPAETTSRRVFEDDLDEFDGALPVTGTVDLNGYEGEFIVEVTTDGGQTWNQAEGKREWRYRFRPFRAQRLQIAARVVTDYVGGDALLRMTDLSVEGPGGEQLRLSPANRGEWELDPGSYTVRMRVRNTGDTAAEDFSLTARMDGRGVIDEWTIKEDGQQEFDLQIEPGASERLRWDLTVPAPGQATSLTVSARRGDERLAELPFTVLPRDDQPGFGEFSALEVIRFQLRKKGEDPTSIPYTEVLEPGSYQYIVGVYNGSDQAVDNLSLNGEMLNRVEGGDPTVTDTWPNISNGQFFDEPLSPGEGRTVRVDFTVKPEHVNRMGRFEVLFNGDPIESGSVPIVPVYSPGTGVSIQTFTLKELKDDDRESREISALEGTSPPEYQVFSDRSYYGILRLYNQTDELQRKVPVNVSLSDRTATYRVERIRPGTTKEIVIPLTGERGRVQFDAGSSDAKDDRSRLAIRLVRPAFTIPDLPDVFTLESPMHVTIPGTQLEFKVDPDSSATREQFYGQAQLVYRRNGRKQLYPRKPIQFGTKDTYFEINSDNVITGISTSDNSSEEISLSFSKQLLVKGFLKLRYDTLRLSSTGADGMQRELEGTVNANFMDQTEFVASNPRRPLLMTAKPASGNLEIGKLPVSGSFWMDLSTSTSPPTPGPAQGPRMQYLDATMEGIMAYDQAVSLPESSPHLPDWFGSALDGSVDGTMNLLVVQEGVGGGIRFDSSIQAGGGYGLDLSSAGAPLKASMDQFARTPEMPIIPYVILNDCDLSMPGWMRDLGFPDTLSFDASSTKWGGQNDEDKNLKLDQILAGSDEGQINVQIDDGGGTPLDIGLDTQSEVSFHMHSGILATEEKGQNSGSGLLSTPVMQFGKPFHLVVKNPEIKFGNSTVRLEELRFSDQVGGSAPFSTHWVLPETSAYRIGLEGIKVSFQAGENTDTSVSSTEPGGSLIKFTNASVTPLGILGSGSTTINFLGESLTVSSSGSSGKTIRIPGIADYWDTDQNEFEDFTMRIDADYAFDTQFDGTGVRIKTTGGLILDFSKQESHVEDVSKGGASRGFVLPDGSIQGPNFFGGSAINFVDFYLTQGGFGGTVEQQDVELNPMPGLTIEADSIGVGFSDGGYAESEVQGGKIRFHPPITAPNEETEVALQDATYKTGENGGMDLYASGSFSSGTLSLPGKFSMTNLDRFLLDFSSDLPSTPPGWAQNASLTSWQGVFFESGVLQMPLRHQGGDQVGIDWKGLKIDAQGASGTFSPQNSLNVQQPLGVPGLTLDIEDSSSLVMKNFALERGDLDGSVTYELGSDNGDSRNVEAKNFSLDVRNGEVGFLCEQFKLPDNSSPVTFGKWDVNVDQIGIDLSPFSNLSDMPDDGPGSDYTGLLLSGGLDWEKKVNIGQDRNKKKTFTFEAEDLTIPFSNGKLSGSFSFNDRAERLKFDLPWGKNGYIWFRSGGLEIAENQFKQATLDGELRVPGDLKNTQPPSQTSGGQFGNVSEDISSVINRSELKQQMQRQKQYLQGRNLSSSDGGNE